VGAQIIGGVTVNIKLPHKGNRVENPLFCLGAARYLMMYWLDRIGLWSNAIIMLTNSALNANVYPCNTSLEGSICQEKNGYCNVKTDMKDVANLIDRRYNDVVEVGKLLSNQIDNSNFVVNRRKERSQRKKQKEEVRVRVHQ
jgi:hypothetical protein